MKKRKLKKFFKGYGESFFFIPLEAKRVLGIESGQSIHFFLKAELGKDEIYKENIIGRWHFKHKKDRYNSCLERGIVVEGSKNLELVLTNFKLIKSVKDIKKGFLENYRIIMKGEKPEECSECHRSFDESCSVCAGISYGYKLGEICGTCHGYGEKSMKIEHSESKLSFMEPFEGLEPDIGWKPSPSSITIPCLECKGENLSYGRKPIEKIPCPECG